MINYIKKLLFPSKDRNAPSKNGYLESYQELPCIGKVRGQTLAKSAMLIAAAGNHNLLLVGPPGEGKTHLASTLPSFLPPLSSHEANTLETLYSEAGYKFHDKYHRPFRLVHHSTSIAGLIGGYSSLTKGIVPGEITLAHNGVLFLDELTEFKRETLDALRQPMEAGVIQVTRSGQQQTFPSQFQLIAASNPCKCGYAGTSHCTCSPYEVRRYLSRISGPIIDRIDMVSRIHPTTKEDLSAIPVANQSKTYLIMVLQARLIQARRNGPGRYNAHLSYDELLKQTHSKATLHLLSMKDKNPKFSTRKLIRTLRVARTVADFLSPLETTRTNHVEVALKFVDFDLAEQFMPKQS